MIRVFYVQFHSQSGKFAFWAYSLTSLEYLGIILSNQQSRHDAGVSSRREKQTKQIDFLLVITEVFTSSAVTACLLYTSDAADE